MNALGLAARALKVDVSRGDPLPDTDIALDEIPTAVQTGTARDIAQRGSLDLPDLLNRP